MLAPFLLQISCLKCSKYYCYLKHYYDNNLVTIYRERGSSAPCAAARAVIFNRFSLQKSGLSWEERGCDLGVLLAPPPQNSLRD